MYLFIYLCIYRDFSSNVRVVVYIAFVSKKFIYEVSNNLFPLLACDVTIQSSADPTMNADLGCLLFAAIEVNG